MPEKPKEPILSDLEIWSEWLRSKEKAIQILGAGGSGKTTLLTALFERLMETGRSLKPLEYSTAEEVSRKETRRLERQPAVSEDVVETKFRELEQKCEKLRIENQLLQSRVAEERRTAARETQRYDQLQVQNDKMLDCLKDRDKAIEQTIALLLERSNARLRMIERFAGVVEHVHGDSVTVVFEIDDDIVEHTYRRSQFIGGQLPEEGDRITVYVHVVHGSIEQEDDASEEADELDEHHEHARKQITGPIEF